MAKKRVVTTFVLLLLALCVMAPSVMADGDETLGPPPDSFPLLGGSQIAIGGTGLAVQPATFEVEVPGGATIRQVILYWGGEGEDDTVTVSGNGVPGASVTGTIIGTVLNAGFPRHSYRADITNLATAGLITAGGANMITIDDVDFGPIGEGFEPDGAGVMVFYDDEAGTVSDVQLRDGADFAFNPEAVDDPPICCTVKQTYNFASRTFDRTATLYDFFGSVQGILSAGGQRPNSIVIEVSNGSNTITQELINPLNSNAGDEWDVFERDVNVPSGYTSVSIQAFSIQQPPPAGGPASFMWVASAFKLPLACLGTIGNFVWEDTNGNGIQDAGEPGIPGVTVTLTKPGGGTETDVTDSSGAYLFSNLCKGTYTVAVTADVPSGLNPTLLNVGNPATDSNNPAGTTVELAADDTTNLTIDFGYVQPATGSCEKKLQQVTFQYTGSDCAASNNTQSGKFVCSDDADSAPIGVSSVRIALQKKNPLEKLSPDSLTVALGGQFTFSTESQYHSFPGQTFIDVLRTDNGQLLQSLSIHTSCSQPFNINDQFGSLKVVGIVNITGGSGNGKPPKN